MSGDDPCRLTAAQAAAMIRDGSLSAPELAEACLARITEREQDVGAWQFLDADLVRAQARAAHDAKREGRPIGPLHGVPVGIKDIFDTADMPTENGSVLHAGRRPTSDAVTVTLLRSAGAVIMGKSVTTEFAVYAPGKTRNPRDPARTPGGSSSGSAAAVADFMVPLALGSQTNGSVIRPAAFCGVCGFKPTHGAISRRGVLTLSRTLDHVGVFARTVEDLALTAETLFAFDDRDPDMAPAARPRLVETAMAAPPVTPLLAFVPSPVWDRAEDDTREAFDALVAALGDGVERVDLPQPFGFAVPHHRSIMWADLARNLAAEYDRGKDRISERLCSMIEEGQQVRAVDYNRAVDLRRVLNAGLETVFDRFDAIITPAAGQAPAGLDSTGDPVFCTLWTLCGTPSVTLPLLEGADGMPIGVQVVGRRGDDARLLRTARWLAATIPGGKA